MDTQTYNFINENLVKRLLPLVVSNADEIDNPLNVLLSTAIQQQTKDNKITLKQKDTFFIVTKEKVILLGDIALPDQNNIEFLRPDVKRDGWHFLSSYLIDSYDMTNPIVIINQSKAEKTHSFELSQGSIVSIRGQVDMRVNLNICKRCAPLLKASEISPPNFNLLCKLVTNEEFDAQEASSADIKKRDALFKKYPVAGTIAAASMLPRFGSDEMALVNYYLREGN
jgi:hypothetical protein